MFNLEISRADIAGDSDGAAAAQPPVCQMDSAPRKSNPDSPKDIWVKLLMSLAGILERSGDGKINPQTPWEAKGMPLGKRGTHMTWQREKAARLSKMQVFCHKLSF